MGVRGGAFTLLLSLKTKFTKNQVVAPSQLGLRLASRVRGFIWLLERRRGELEIRMINITAMKAVIMVALVKIESLQIVF